MKPTIGLMLVVRNEEARIKACLDWHIPYVDEVAVCDQESTDKTLAIIKNYRAHSKVPFHLISDKAAGFPETSKEKTAKLLHTDWILLVDADETFSEMFLEKMHDIVQENEKNFDGFNFPRNNIFKVKVFDDTVPIEPKWLEVTHPSRDYQLRLVRRKLSYFPPYLHHRVRVSGKTNGERISIIIYAINHIKTIMEQWEDQGRYKDIIKKDHV